MIRGFEWLSFVIRMHFALHIGRSDSYLGTAVKGMVKATYQCGFSGIGWRRTALKRTKM